MMSEYAIDTGLGTPSHRQERDAVVGIVASKPPPRPPSRAVSSALLKQQERLNQETETELKGQAKYDAWDASTKELFRVRMLENNSLKAGGCEVATPKNARASGGGNLEGAKLSGDGGSPASRKRKSDTAKAKPCGQQRVSLVVSALAARKKAARKTAADEEEEEDFAKPTRVRSRDDKHDIPNRWVFTYIYISVYPVNIWYICQYILCILSIL
jgi:hypothetical protein